MACWCRFKLEFWFFVHCMFLDPEGGSQNATLVVLVVVISSLRVQKCLRLSLYAAERNEILRTHSCLHCPQIYCLIFSTCFLINE